MLAIHWSPVSNTKNILRNGIRKARNGVYCFPLTGIHTVDAWWVKAFNQFCFRRNRKQYNGFIFRVTEEDMPCYFGHFIGHTSRDKFEMPINTVTQLENEIKESVLWRIGERINGYEDILQHHLASDKFIDMAKQELQKDPKIYSSVTKDVGFMEFIFEDQQIVLSKSIAPERIIKIVSARDEFGKVLYKKKKYSLTKDVDY